MKYSLKKLTLSDSFKIMKWRNEQMSVLRQRKSLTSEKQKEHFEEKILPEYLKEEPEQLLFGFCQDGILIGYGGLVHISWSNKRAEVSFLVDTLRAVNNKDYENDFTNFLILIKKLAFEKLSLNRIYTETYSFRNYHISILEKNGFQLEGKMKEHIYHMNQFYD